MNTAFDINLYCNLTADGGVLTPVASLLNGLLSGLNQLVSGLLSLVGNLLDGILNTLNNFLVRYTVIIPALQTMQNNLDQLFPNIYPYYKNATFQFEFFLGYGEIQRLKASLLSSSTPLTNQESQNDLSNFQNIQQEYSQLLFDYNLAFSTNCSNTCNQSSIQVADCSCRTSNNIKAFLNTFENEFAPFHQQLQQFVNNYVGQDFGDDILSFADIYDINQVAIDSQNVYQYIYSNNGNVNETQVNADLAQIVQDIHTLVAAFSGKPVLAPALINVPQNVFDLFVDSVV